MLARDYDLVSFVRRVAEISVARRTSPHPTRSASDVLMDRVNRRRERMRSMSDLLPISSTRHERRAVPGMYSQSRLHVFEPR